MADSKWQRRLLESRRAGNKTTIEIIQNPLGIAGGQVQNTLNKIVTGEILESTPLEGLDLGSGTLKTSRYWRYRLLTKPDNGMEKASYSPRPGIMGDGNLPVSIDEHTTRPADLSLAEYRSVDMRKIISRRTSKNFVPVGRDYTALKFKALEQLPKEHQNNIFIVNENVSPYISLMLQNRPQQLEVNPHGTWASVQSMGRNNPFMMYTGGEDTVSFEISWYASDKDRRDEVIMKCKLLESWCKANGYIASPPVLKLIWGNSGLFDNCFFILESAPYRLTNFQDRTRDSEGKLVDLKLYPNCATQQLTFKRVSTDNTTYEDIVPSEKLKGINGIITD